MRDATSRPIGGSGRILLKTDTGASVLACQYNGMQLWWRSYPRGLLQCQFATA